MKRCISGFLAVILLCSLVLAGCSADSKKTESAPSEVVKEQYQCPMCKDQLFDKPGKCPTCEMELVKVTKS
jgi:nitrous oxide reductase accessory protein NosL